MNINYKYKKTTRAIKLVCGLLFSVYSFVYTYIFQSDVIEALHFSLAHGKTSYAPLTTAIILTLLLLVLSMAVSKILNIKGRWEVLAYAPAFVILTSLTDISREIYTYNYNSNNILIYPLAFIFVIAILYAIRKFLHTTERLYNSVTGLYNLNSFFMLVFFIITLSVANTDRTFHNELKIEKMIRNGNYEKALLVGKKAVEPSRTITALRNYSMAITHTIGSKLFEFPQLYGSEGLFFDNDSTKTLRYNNLHIYQLIGKQQSDVTNVKAFMNVSTSIDSCQQIARDYCLAALMLNKNLETLANIIDTNDIKERPQYYIQAITMYQKYHPEYTRIPLDSICCKEYEKYLNYKSSFEDSKIEYKEMRYRYGTTYWWYHDYQEVKK